VEKMPTYGYECKSCRKRFEKFQTISEEPLKECIFCGSGKVVRLIGAGAGVIFKGTGFYQTDYKNREKTDTERSDTKSREDKSGEKTERFE
jgi:putative FmdB family regulatory protein